MRPDDEAPSSRASRLANAASFSFTSPVHSFRSRRNAVRSRELSRICAWRFTDIWATGTAETASRLARVAVRAEMRSQREKATGTVFETVGSRCASIHFVKLYDQKDTYR